MRALCALTAVLPFRHSLVLHSVGNLLGRIVVQIRHWRGGNLFWDWASGEYWIFEMFLRLAVFSTVSKERAPSFLCRLVGELMVLDTTLRQARTSLVVCDGRIFDRGSV